jgi:phosphatidylinositol-3-phosphatase
VLKNLYTKNCLLNIGPMQTTHRHFARRLGLPWMGLSLLVVSAKPIPAATFRSIDTVFVIVMENTDWSAIKGSANAPYINQTLLPMASYAEQYRTFTHPSPGNYLWLEAGTDFGIYDDYGPLMHPLTTTNHFVDLLEKAGIGWRVYAEGISGTNCPTQDISGYLARHNPFVFFTDVNADKRRCRTNIRPYVELTADLLARNSVARYNFLIPDRCHDGHDYCHTNGQVWQMDNWLSQEIPMITNSAAYLSNGSIFLLWDEGSFQTNGVQGDGPMPFIVLSPLAKGGGYSNAIPYTHSSTLRTLQEIFGVSPFLGDAANAHDLSDLFNFLQLQASVDAPANRVEIQISGLIPGGRTLLQGSSDLSFWSEITNFIPATYVLRIQDPFSPNLPSRYYRAVSVGGLLVEDQAQAQQQLQGRSTGARPVTLGPGKRVE